MAEEKTHEMMFTEAPASFNVKCISPQGFDCMLTLRDVDAPGLMTRAWNALNWLAEKGFTPTTAPAAARSGNGGGNGNAPLCPVHQKPMKESSKKPGTWYCTAKIAEDGGDGKPVYCKQKA